MLLVNNFQAMFNNEKSPLVANVLIQRALAGDYSDTREIGPSDGRGSDQLIIGTLYLMVADENTLPLVADADAFVLRIEHEARMVDYYQFTDVEQARAFLSANG